MTQPSDEKVVEAKADREKFWENLDQAASNYLFSSMKEYLIDRYYRKGMTIAEVTEELQVIPEVVPLAMKQHRFPLREEDKTPH